MKQFKFCIKVFYNSVFRQLKKAKTGKDMDNTFLFEATLTKIILLDQQNF